MTVFDAAVLDRLVEDTDSRPFVVDLARTFQRMLPARVGRLLATLVIPDLDDAMDAVLSLRVSCTVTGGAQLAELARLVEGAIRLGDLAGARAISRAMPDASEALDVELERYLKGAHQAA